MPFWTFRIAAVYGVMVLLPLCFAEWTFARFGRVPVNHPEYLYGFVGAALVLQWLYWTIGGDPVHFRPLMKIAVAAKLSFAGAVLILFALDRCDTPTFGFAVVDLLIGILFWVAWRRTPAA